MLLPGRDREHRLRAGDHLTIGGQQVRHEYQFQQGLCPEHARALAGRQDLATRLYALALWGAPAKDLDAAVEALLAEHA